MPAPAALKTALAEARANTDALFGVVRPGSLYERPIAERHRIVFYIGHLEAFDWNLLREPLGLEASQPALDKLFAFGIDPPVGQMPQDRPSDWPLIGETRAYNQRIRERLDAALDRAPEQLLHVAIEHRLMHAETLAYMLHSLPPGAKTAPQATPAPSGEPVATRMIEIPAGTATLGRRSGNGFGWDNEFHEAAVPTPAFAISKYKVTNGEYLQFVRSGAAPPHFWIERKGAWYYRGMFGEAPLALDAPVWVTEREAEAYARWAGRSLPTEAQFHRAAYATPEGGERLYPWGEEPPRRGHGNFDFASWDPVPVTSTPAGDSAFGVSQLLGNGWEWTSTPFAPFPGFEPFPFYPGYSANFFDGAHYVIKGGSPRTAAPLLRRSFRNWFRPDYPYVYAGFRLVEN
jgi:formylglycine-generating enzyme required for sulfatase activity